MFLNNLKQKSLQFARPLLYNRLSLFGTHAPPPEKLQKVKDIWYLLYNKAFILMSKITMVLGKKSQLL